MTCPLCGQENNDDWPIEVMGRIEDGGCQECWERQTAASWWRMVKAIYGGHKAQKGRV